MTAAYGIGIYVAVVVVLTLLARLAGEARLNQTFGVDEWDSSGSDAVPFYIVFWPVMLMLAAAGSPLFALAALIGATHRLVTGRWPE